MDLNYKVNLIFPVPIHQFDVNGFSEIQDELIDYVYEMKEKDPVGHTISNRGGWQSSCFTLENQEDKLQCFLSKCLGKFPTIKESVRLYVSAWVNINPPEAFNMKHKHPTSDLSGVLWLQAPKECGKIVFDSPRSFAIHQEVECYTEGFKENNNYFHSYQFDPVEGRLVVFPSHLDHHVEFNKSQEDRISVSFNIRLQE